MFFRFISSKKVDIEIRISQKIENLLYYLYINTRKIYYKEKINHI